MGGMFALLPASCVAVAEWSSVKEENVRVQKWGREKESQAENEQSIERACG